MSWKKPSLIFKAWMFLGMSNSRITDSYILMEFRVRWTLSLTYISKTAVKSLHFPCELS